MIFSCGCSFTAGCGLDHPERDAFGQIVAFHLGAEHRNIAKHSGSNCCIMHQIRHAVAEKAELVLIGTTTPDRFDWIKTGCSLDHEVSILDFDYHSYHPHSAEFHPFVGNPKYNPVILSDSFASILAMRKKSIWEILGLSKDDYFIRRLGTEIDRLDLIRDYMSDLYDLKLKVAQDRAYIISGIRLLEQAAIPYVIIDSFLGLDHAEIPRKSLITNLLFGELAAKYPDRQNTLHFSEEGHEIVAKVIVYHLREYA